MASATGLHAARRGLKTLIVSTDPAHSLADAFGGQTRIGDVPTEVESGLYLQQVDPQRAFELGWQEVSGWLAGMLEQGGVDPLEAEELTVLPGAEELLALLELRNQVRAGRFDVIVVDCAPTGETLRLLALPDALSWWMRRIFPTDRRVARALRPVVANLIGVPAPPDAVYAAAQRLCAELADVRALLTDERTTSIRLVVTPESLVLAEARRAATSLSLYGYRVDGIIANRIFPGLSLVATGDGNEGGDNADGNGRMAGNDRWVAGWAAAQAKAMDAVSASFPGLPLWRAAYAAAEPVGPTALAELAKMTYGDPAGGGLSGSDPLAVIEVAEPVAVERVAKDEFVLTIVLPHAAAEEIHLARKGDDLLVTVAGWRRVLALPAVLCRCVVDGAGLVDGRLIVRFRADPDLWMRS